MSSKYDAGGQGPLISASVTFSPGRMSREGEPLRPFAAVSALTAIAMRIFEADRATVDAYVDKCRIVKEHYWPLLLECGASAARPTHNHRQRS